MQINSASKTSCYLDHLAHSRISSASLERRNVGFSWQALRRSFASNLILMQHLGIGSVNQRGLSAPHTSVLAASSLQVRLTLRAFDGPP
jgi:hypothetical protein